MATEAKLKRCRRSLRSEKQVNEELAKRLRHSRKDCKKWRDVAEQRAKDITRLEAELTLARQQPPHNTVQHHLCLPTPAVVDSLSTSSTLLLVSPPTTPRRSSPVHEQDGTVSLTSPQLCESPRWSSSSCPQEEAEEETLVTLSQSLRSSNASHLMRSLWRTSRTSTSASTASNASQSSSFKQLELDPPPQPLQQQRPIASAFFVAGPSHSDIVKHNQIVDTMRVKEEQEEQEEPETAQHKKQTRNISCAPRILRKWV